MTTTVSKPPPAFSQRDPCRSIHRLLARIIAQIAALGTLGLPLVCAAADAGDDGSANSARTGASSSIGTRPLWELGLGVGAVSFPDYRGSKNQGTYVLPTPYFVYRGELFRADRNGMRGILFDTDRVKLNLSLAASLPIKSDDSGARSGMPNLKSTVELGPSLEFSLWRSQNERTRLDLRLPVRAAFTVERSPRYVGLIASPNLNLDILDPLGARGWNLGLLAGPLFANERQHAYFYGVDPQYANAARPEYRTHGGYSGAHFITALSKRFDRYWVGAFVRYDTLHGAAFAASPLVQQRHSWAGGVAFSWVFAESGQRVLSSER
ncbi:MAG: MipA/OmpV family protein [Burkholderiales bacterium]